MKTGHVIDTPRNGYDIGMHATPGLLASTCREDLGIAIGSWLALEGRGASLWLRCKLNRSLELQVRWRYVEASWVLVGANCN